METISLRLPSTYVEVNGSEMEYLDGLGLFSKIWSTVCAAVGGGVTIAALGSIVAIWA